MRELIIGGARSGKSTFAEKRALESGLRVVYVATAQILDGEMERRVALHRVGQRGEFRRLAPLYPNTVVINRDQREFHSREGLRHIIEVAGLPPFREIPYEVMDRYEPR